MTIYLRKFTVKLFKISEAVSSNINISLHHIFTDRNLFDVNARTTLTNRSSVIMAD